MQNTPIPASLNAAPASTGTTALARQGATNGDGPSFSQALTSMVAQRQIEQRRQDSAASAAGRPVAAAQLPANAPAPAAFVHGAPTPPQQPPSTPQPSKAPEPASAAPADGGQTTAAAEEAAGTAKVSTEEEDPATPVADLIALVASFNQPAETTGTTATDASAAAPASVASNAAADAAIAAPVADTSAQLAVAGAAPALQPASAAPARPAGTPGLSSTLDGAARPGARTLTALPAGRPDPSAAAGAADSTVSNDAAAAGTTHPASGASAVPDAASDKPAFADVLQSQARSQSAAADPAPLRAALASAHDSLPAAVNGPLAAPVQQAALAVAQAAGTPADRLAARVGTPDWNAQLGQKIIWMAAGQDQSATLTLNPPDLGPVQVVLSVSNDQAQVTFSSAQPEVRQALENAMPKLRDMMSESGIALGNATVNDGAAEQRQAGQGEQARGRGQGHGQDQTGGRDRGDQGGVAEVPVRRGRMIGGGGAVDTFA